jgi:hypothetical protein
MEVELSVLADRLRRLPPSAGTVTVVAVDGRSGSGKSTLGGLLGVELGAPVLQLEEMYPGWNGLLGGIRVAREGVLDRFASGTDASWPIWDWDASQPGPLHGQVRVPLVILEGCGSGAHELADGVAALLWVDLGADERLARVRGRGDWAGYEPFHAMWAQQEDELFARDLIPQRADVVIDGASIEAASRGGNVSLRFGGTSRLRDDRPS